MPSRSHIESVLATHEATDLSADTVFELLAARRRRYLLESLAEHGYSLTLADLADEVAARETGAHITEIPEGDVLDIYLSLYHTHLPKLEAAKVVAYDQDNDLVGRGRNAVVLEGVLSNTLDG